MSADSTAATRVSARGVAASWIVLPVLLAVFFVSGVSGLVYQVVWMRLLSLTFGVTSFAVATVLSGFMAGLALGAFLAGRIAHRVRQPLAAYAGAELLIALSGALSPALFAAVRLLYTAIVGASAIDSLFALSALRFGLAFLALLIPTTMMGATLPLIVRSSLLRRADVARNVSLLYAVNTFGAATGAFVAGFYLIGRFGLTRTLVTAAVLNLAAAAAALALSRVRVREPLIVGPSAAAREVAYPALVRRVTVAAFAVSGAVSLAYEVVWARVLTIFFDATTYGFTIMLTMVLLGIGLGSWLIAPLISRRWNWPLLFAGIQAGVGLLGLLAVPLLARMVTLTDALGLYADPGPLGQFSVKFMAAVSALVVFPSMFLLGASFPIAARIVATGRDDAGRDVGLVYAANVCGAIIGAFIGGFVLLPRLGAQASLLTLAACSVALAVVLAVSLPRRRPAWRLGMVAGGALAVTLGVALAPDLFRSIFERRLRDQTVVSIDEGLENMTIVTDVRATGERKLYLNGQPQASTVGFVAGFHQLIGHTGMLIKPEARRALVIGFGGGATAGAVARHSQTQVEVVELSSAVTRAAPYFTAINGGVLDRPNVTLRHDDGRNFLLLTETKYDLITADIIRPRHAGASNVYTTEYFKLVRDALADDGVMVQWMEQLSEQQYKLLVRTFVDVFPYVSVWANGSLLVGSKTPVFVDPGAMMPAFLDPETGPALATIGLRTPQDLLDLYVGDRDEALRYVGDGPVITDDRPYVEYYRSLGGADRLPDVSGFSRDWQKIVKPAR